MVGIEKVTAMKAEREARPKCKWELQPYRGTIFPNTLNLSPWELLNTILAFTTSRSVLRMCFSTYCHSPHEFCYKHTLTSHVGSTHTTHLQCVWRPTSDMSEFVQVFVCGFRIIALCTLLHVLNETTLIKGNIETKVQFLKIQTRINGAGAHSYTQNERRAKKSSPTIQNTVSIRRTRSHRKSHSL